MGISNDLISQFVKATKSDTKTKSESTVYGTVVTNGDSLYVQIDGSDSLTPISKTANIGAGDRVTVLIKNHTAVITGNVTNPSARVITKEDGSFMVEDLDISGINKKINEFETIVADVVRTGELNTEIGKIETLISNHVIANDAIFDELRASDANISGELSANKATIDSLKTSKLDVEVADAKYATIDSLSATNANIYNLSATHSQFVTTTTDKLDAIDGVIDSLNTTYATIADLDVERAKIVDLNASVADIDTLIFGSASGSVIQTSFANAVIAQLGDAQIKSAMIESVYAEKITSGSIYTNNVHVRSKDGRLFMSGETLQIRDSKRIRVQIGKDGYDDYSISVWDADGNLMFSKGGITDSAIKQAIIRNDMVSDTANISASKLDIDSLFEEINNSSKTIKSTKVKFDTTGQTLDVAFTSLTTNVSDLGETVSSQGTSISTIQGQISSKIWTSDCVSIGTFEQAVLGMGEDIHNVGEQLNTLSTNYSTLEQEIDSISTTVASHTTEIGKKANSSTVTTINNKVTTLEQNFSGFKTTVSDTYVTKNVYDANVGGIMNTIDEVFEQIDTVETRTSTLEQTAAGLTVELTNSAKTATNFLNYDSINGLLIGNKTSGSWDGLRAQILPSAYNILSQNGTVLASYGEKLIELGKNSSEAVISLCGDKGQIEFDSQENYLQITGDYLRLYGNHGASLYSNYYNNSNLGQRSAINVAPDAIYMYSQESTNIDPDTLVGVWTTSTLMLDQNQFYLLTNTISETSRYGSTYTTVSGDINFDPSGKTRSKATFIVSASGKSSHNDGVEGWYIGSDGTAHATSLSGGSLIAFHYKGSKDYTSIIRETASGTISINGIPYATNKILWSGVYYMSASQTAPLSEAISNQANGIVLVFSRYSSGQAQNHHFQTFFVPKGQVSNHAGCGHTFLMSTDGTFGLFAAKYLYINASSIVGNDVNTSTGEGACGIKYTNNGFVLRYVIGV